MVDRLLAPLNSDTVELDNFFKDDRPDWQQNLDELWSTDKYGLYKPKIILAYPYLIPMYLWRVFFEYSDFWLWLKY